MTQLSNFLKSATAPSSTATTDIAQAITGTATLTGDGFKIELLLLGISTQDDDALDITTEPMGDSKGRVKITYKADPAKAPHQFCAKTLAHEFGLRSDLFDLSDVKGSVDDHEILTIFIPRLNKTNKVNWKRMANE